MSLFSPSPPPTARNEKAGADDGRKIVRVALNLLFAERPAPVRRILKRFPEVGEFFKAPPSELEALGLRPEEARRVLTGSVLGEAEKELEKCRKKSYTLLTFEDESYPGLLKEIFDPPLVLYCAGGTEALQGPAVAVVGARKPTPYGRTVAERLAADLASRGIVIVSGLARGVDSCAHWGALREGRTVAVLGSGLDVVYPAENRDLCRKIAESGAVVTEYPLGTRAWGSHFPLRNRIISGLALGLVVVEAAERSGSLISARLALEQDREVMAVPGSALSPQSKGANRLLKSGAALVEDWRDVAEELPSPWREELLARDGGSPGEPPELNAEERNVVQWLPSDGSLHIDELVERTDRSVSEILSLLLGLELKGLVFQLPGKMFQRRM